MRISEIPPMPWPKYVFYLFLLSTAIFIFCILLWKELLTKERLAATAVGVMLSLFITASTDLIPEFARRIESRSKRGRFKKFFGEAATRRHVRLVFAHRTLKSDVLKSNPWVTHHQAPENYSAEGVNAWLAFQDNRAAAYLTSMIFDMTASRARLIHDKDIEEDDFDFCAISIGLGFNGFTHRLAWLCDNKLFEIVFGKSPKDPNFETDLFKINGVVPDIPSGKDDCIIARIVLRPTQGGSKRICFVCAGRTASGTAAAGLFLAQEWDRLMKIYEHNKDKDLDLDSLVVVVRHTADDLGTRKYEYDTTGVIIPDLIHWHRVTGVEKG